MGMRREMIASAGPVSATVACHSGSFQRREEWVFSRQDAEEALRSEGGFTQRKR
jgi:hypothetical protein